MKPARLACQPTYELKDLSNAEIHAIRDALSRYRDFIAANPGLIADERYEVVIDLHQQVMAVTS